MLSNTWSCTSHFISLTEPSNTKKEFSPIHDKKLPEVTTVLGDAALQLVPASCMPYIKGEPV